MKKVLIALLALTITNCGWKNAYDDIHDLQDQVDTLQDQVNSLNERVSAIELEIDTQIVYINDLQSQIDALGSDLDALDAYTRFQVEDLWRELFFANNKINQLIVDLVALRVRVEGLEATDTAVELLDPCGNGPGFDEVLVRMKSGKVVAYFESGSNRFLSVLTPNQQYRTTDGTNCNFRVDAQGNLL